MRKKILLMLTMILLCGCAHNTMLHNKTIVTTNSDWPLLNQQTSVYVGEEMLVQGTLFTSKVLILNETISGDYIIPSGTYPIVGEDGNRMYFSLRGSNGQVQVAHGFVSMPQGLVIDKKNMSKLCVLDASILSRLVCFDANQKIGEIEAAGADSRQRTLLYSGCDGKQIKFTYVERGAGRGSIFQHDVSYDFNKSATINYRGARINIRNANNEQITYTVLQNFPDRNQQSKAPDNFK